MSLPVFGMYLDVVDIRAEICRSPEAVGRCLPTVQKVALFGALEMWYCYNYTSRWV
jgi:hypothetical protein